jgi:hypothetical protein
MQPLDFFHDREGRDGEIRGEKVHFTDGTVVDYKEAAERSLWILFPSVEVRAEYLAMDKYSPCDDCGQSFKYVPLGPMLHDDLWAKLGSEEWLCGDCLFQRAAQLGIQVTIDDLKPGVPLNDEWFEVLSSEM